MSVPREPQPTRVATLALPTRESHVLASVWPGSPGTLMVVAEINLSPSTRQELATAITGALERSWETTRSNPNLSEPGDMLEPVLLDLNRVLKGHERLLGNPLAPRYHILVAVTCRNTVALSAIGNMGGYLLHQDKLTNIISNQSKARATKPAFQSLYTGELEPGETLLLTTSELFDYLPPARLISLFARQAPGLALRQVEHSIMELEHHPPLGVVAFRLGDAQAASTTSASLDHLLETQHATSLLLKPKLFSFLSKGFSRNKPQPDIGEQLPEAYPPEPEQSEIETEASVSLPAPLPEVRSKPRSHPLRKLVNMARATAQGLTWLSSREGIKSRLAWWSEAKLNSLRRMPLGRRTLVLLALAILIIFAQTLVTQGKHSLTQQDSERYNELVAGITERQALAEGALIYHDDAGALKLLAEADEMVKLLPRTTRSRAQQAEALERSLNLSHKRLERQVEVANLQPWATLAELPNGNRWVSLAVLNGVPYVLGSNRTVAELAEGGSIKNTLSLPAELGEPAGLLTLPGTMLLVRGTNGTQALVNTATKKISLLATPLELLDGSTYEKNFYYLSSREPTNIYRTSMAGVAFSTPARWLKGQTSLLSGALSLAVDGNIYVLRNGTIERYTRGVKTDFSPQRTTGLVASSLIRTDGASQYIYALSPAHNQVVVYDKQGKLVSQLNFPQNLPATTMGIDTISQTLYILSNHSVFKVKPLEYRP